MPTLATLPAAPPARTEAHTQRFTTLAYYGGKNARQVSGTGRRIARLLPMRGCYVEPFAGMLGILLQRPEAPIEIVNDLNSDLINWWRCVRDEPEDFQHRVDHSPSSREEFALSCAILEEPWQTNGSADIRRGVAFHNVIGYSVMHGVKQHNSWGCHYRSASSRVTNTSVIALAKRMRKVQIENRDACEVLERVAPIDDMVVYVDPPYLHADTSVYAHEPDRERLRAALAQQKGFCAVSGYGDEWDCLAWHRYEMPSMYAYAGRKGGTVERRTEVLWLNAEPETRSLFG